MDESKIGYRNFPDVKSKLSRDLFILKSLVKKDFKIRYRRSALGALWSVLNPLMMMIVMTLVFSFMFRFEIENYPFYLILGQILFALMTGSTNSSMNSIVDASPLLKKVKINKILLPLEKVSFETLNFAISMSAVVMVMLWYKIVPTLTILLLPLLLLYVVVFSFGLGLLLATLAVFFRDIVHLWSIVIMAWNYATPIFYPIDVLSCTVQKIMMFNPMYHYINYFRDIMMNNKIPSLEENLVCIVFSLISFIIGYFVFKKSQNKFILYI